MDARERNTLRGAAVFVLLGPLVGAQTSTLTSIAQEANPDDIRLYFMIGMTVFTIGAYAPGLAPGADLGCGRRRLWRPHPLHVASPTGRGGAR